MGALENLSFHDFWICGTPGSPYLWIRVYRTSLKKLRQIKDYFKQYSFAHLEFGNMRFAEFDNSGILEIRKLQFNDFEG